MFNIGPLELIAILIVALIVVGPKRLPEMGRSIGKSLREFRRASDEVRQSLDFDLDHDYEDEEDVEEGRRGEGAGPGAADRRAVGGPAEAGEPEEPADSAEPRGSAAE